MHIVMYNLSYTSTTNMRVSVVLLLLIAVNNVAARSFGDLECRILSTNGSSNNQIECTSESIDKIYDSNRSLWFVLSVTIFISLGLAVCLASLLYVFVSRYGNVKMTIDWSSATAALQSIVNQCATADNVTSGTNAVLRHLDDKYADKESLAKLVVANASDVTSNFNEKFGALGETFVTKKDMAEVMATINAQFKLLNGNVVEVYRHCNIQTQYFAEVENERPDKGPNRIQAIVQRNAQQQAAQEAAARGQPPPAQPQQRPAQPQLVDDNEDNIADDEAPGEGKKVHPSTPPSDEEIAKILAQYTQKKSTAKATEKPGTKSPEKTPDNPATKVEKVQEDNDDTETEVVEQESPTVNEIIETATKGAKRSKK